MHIILCEANKKLLLVGSAGVQLFSVAQSKSVQLQAPLTSHPTVSQPVCWSYDQKCEKGREESDSEKERQILRATYGVQERERATKWERRETAGVEGS